MSVAMNSINQNQLRQPGRGSKLSSLARAGQDILTNYGADVGQKKFYGGRDEAAEGGQSSNKKAAKVQEPPRGLTRLRYKVVAFSSEDPRFPA